MGNSRKRFIIDGSHFDSLDSFYDEIERVLCSDFHMGRNLNAFNDVLRGGFGKYEYEEPIDLTWRHSEKSRHDLGYKETVKYCRKSFFYCLIAGPYSNLSKIRDDLKRAKAGEGETIFDELIDIIKDNPHIHLKLD